MVNTPLIPPRVPLTDPRTGLISREWYRYLMSQATLTGGSALTRTNDSNVTLTLGGAPGTALLAPVSLTLGWSGVLPISRGGTGAGTAAEALMALGGASETYVDAGDAATLTSAEAYTDAAIAALPPVGAEVFDLLVISGYPYGLTFDEAGNIVTV